MQTCFLRENLKLVKDAELRNLKVNIHVNVAPLSMLSVALLSLSRDKVSLKVNPHYLKKRCSLKTQGVKCVFM